MQPPQGMLTHARVPILRRGLASTLLEFLRLPPIHLQKMIHSIHTCMSAYPHTYTIRTRTGPIYSAEAKLCCARKGGREWTTNAVDTPSHTTIGSLP